MLSLPADNRIQHHWSSVIHGFLISTPPPLLFQLQGMNVYKYAVLITKETPSQLVSTDDVKIVDPSVVGRKG